MTTIAEMQKRLARAGTAFDGIAQSFLPPAASDLRLRGIEFIKAETPTDETRIYEPNPRHDERLADTTVGELVTQGTGGMVLFGQTKTVSKIGGKPFPLARLLRSGRTGGYEVKPKLHDALVWYDTQGKHVRDVTHPGPVNSNLYANKAALALLPVARARFREAGNDMLRALTRELTS